MLPHAQRFLIFLASTFVGFILMTSPVYADQSLMLISGNGLVGGQDNQIKFSSFGNLQANIPTASDFIAAQNGVPATIFSDAIAFANDGFTPLPNYPSAHFVGSSAGGSSLFSIPFTLTGNSIVGASFDFQFHVDNYLGGSPPAAQGIYLNGTSLSGDTRFYDPLNQPIFFSGMIARNDIAPLLIPHSTNWLYINVTDRLPGDGIWFGATIHTVTTPEPGAIALLTSMVVFGMALCLWRRRHFVV